MVGYGSPFLFLLIWKRTLRTRSLWTACDARSKAAILAIEGFSWQLNLVHILKCVIYFVEYPFRDFCPFTINRKNVMPKSQLVVFSRVKKSISILQRCRLFDKWHQKDDSLSGACPIHNVTVFATVAMQSKHLSAGRVEQLLGGAALKYYEGKRRQGLGVVTVNGYPLNPRFDLRTYSPSGFDWGYTGGGPAQLALALVSDVLGDDAAKRWHRDFKDLVVASSAHNEWALSDDQIRYAVQSLGTVKKGNQEAE